MAVKTVYFPIYREWLSDDELRVQQRRAVNELNTLKEAGYYIAFETIVHSPGRSTRVSMLNYQSQYGKG
jgi:hypothetical protein